MDFNKLLLNGELNGSEIKNLASSFGLKVNIYEYDRLPKHLKKGNYIILLGKGRGHWTALYVLKNTAAFYDSFGTTPPKEIVNALGRKRILFFNEKEEQTLNANHCGQFSLRFLYNISNQ